jgi:hypothetical protein
MRKALSLMLVGALAVASLPGCILTPLHPERRQVTRWDWELVRMDDGIKDVPVMVFGAVLLPVAWVVDSFIVNPIDSYKGAMLDTHDIAWDDVDEGKSQAYVKSHGRTFGALILGPFDFMWRANSPVMAGPHNPDAWKFYWNTHVEVTEAK